MTNIKVVKLQKGYQIVLDDIPFTINEIAARCAMDRDAVYQGILLNLENASRYIRMIMWRHDVGIKDKCKIYYRSDYEFCAIPLLMELVEGLDYDAARRRLNRWTKKIIDTDRLYIPVGFGKFGFTEQLVNHIKTQDLLKDMQPRRSIESLGKAGIWEKENCHSETFTSTEKGPSHVVCNDPNGTVYMRGD